MADVYMYMLVVVVVRVCIDVNVVGSLKLVAGRVWLSILSRMLRH